MREKVTVVTLSVCVCVSLLDFGEGAFFSGLKLTLGDDLSPLNSTFLNINAILEKKRVELRP